MQVCKFRLCRYIFAALINNIQHKPSYSNIDMGGWWAFDLKAISAYAYYRMLAIISHAPHMAKAPEALTLYLLDNCQHTLLFEQNLTGDVAQQANATYVMQALHLNHLQVLNITINIGPSFTAIQCNKCQLKVASLSQSLRSSMRHCAYHCTSTALIRRTVTGCKHLLALVFKVLHMMPVTVSLKLRVCSSR